jgi:hypothetical protein
VFSGEGDLEEVEEEKEVVVVVVGGAGKRDAEPIAAGAGMSRPLWASC